MYSYTCTDCGLIVRVNEQSTGKDITACMCNAEIIEQQENPQEPLSELE